MTPFEQAVSDILIPGNDTENVIESQGDDSMIVDFQNGAKLCTVSLSRKKWINLIEEYAEKYPNEVTIKYRNKDGSIVAHMPVTYLHIYRPRELSEEQIETMRASARKNLHGDSTGEN